MENKQKSNRENQTEDLATQQDKTATDNQWVSVGGYKGYMCEEQDKTAKNNQWNSTIKNSN